VIQIGFGLVFHLFHYGLAQPEGMFLGNKAKLLAVSNVFNDF